MENMDISKVIFHLRDIKAGMVDAWQEEFAPYSNTVKVRKGDWFHLIPNSFIDGGLLLTRKTAWSRPPLRMWTLLGMPIEWVKYTTQEYEI